MAGFEFNFISLFPEFLLLLPGAWGTYIYQFRYVLWIALGAAIVAIAWRATEPGRARKVTLVSALLVYLLMPRLAWEARAGIREYAADQQKWIDAKCREALATPVTLADGQLQRVEGFLDGTDYDRLINDRWRRARGIAQTVGMESSRVPAGGYAHPLHRVIRGGTFAGKARFMLTAKRFSFYEFEMLQQTDGSYSNPGLPGALDTKGWSGTRYRHYYLAPHGHRLCVSERSGPSGTTSIAGRPVKPILTSDESTCVALEILRQPQSKYRLIAEEESRREWRTVWVRRFVPVPATLNLRWDILRIIRIEDGREVGRYSGFDYPNEVAPTHRCNSESGPEKLLTAVLAPDEKRASLQAKDWYSGSSVDDFYSGRPVAPPQIAGPPEPPMPTVSYGSNSVAGALGPTLTPIKPMVPAASAQTVQALFQSAQAASGQGDRRAALKLYDEIVALAPDYWPARLNRGNERTTLGDVSGAIADFSAAIRSQEASGFPGFDASAYMNRASAYLKAGDSAKALEDLNFALSKVPGESGVLYNRGWAYLQSGDFEAARRDADALIGMRIMVADAHMLRCWSSLLLGDANSAQADAAASLAVSANWTPQLARQRTVAFRLVCAVLAHERAAQRDAALRLIKEWEHLLVATEWPDAMLFHFRGDADSEALRVAAKDERQAMESAAWRGLLALYRGNHEEAKALFQSVARGKGHSLSKAIALGSGGRK